MRNLTGLSCHIQALLFKMPFSKIASDVIIVPFITSYLKKKETIERRLAVLFNNPYDSDNELDNVPLDKAPLYTSIIGYFNGTDLVMFRNKEYYETIDNFLADVLLKKSSVYNKFSIYKGKASFSTINSDMAELIKQDIFNIESTEFYTSDNLSKMYISYVNSFDTD